MSTAAAGRPVNAVIAEIDNGPSAEPESVNVRHAPRNPGMSFGAYREARSAPSVITMPLPNPFASEMTIATAIYPTRPWPRG